MTLGAIEAAVRNGFEPQIAFAADAFEDAARVYKNNFASALHEFYEGDLREMFPPEGLAKGAPNSDEIDLLVAGPPCQGHSDLNNSTRRSDPRNQLYLSAITAIEHFKPKFCVIENVPTVIHDTTGVTHLAVKRLERAGYAVQEVELRMERLGIPQKRRRHLIVGTRGTATSVSDWLERNKQPEVTLLDFIGDLSGRSGQTTLFDTPSKMTPENASRAALLIEKGLFELPDEYRPACHRDKVHSYKSVYGRLRWDSQAQTITSGFGSMGQGRYVHPSEPRTITPHEAARIQGFPDFFSFDSVAKRTKLQEMIGNAVPPPAMATVVQALLSTWRG